VNEDADAGRSKGGTVVVVGAVELGPRGELRIDAGAAKKIQREERLG
jgi:hypothetical protein